MVMHISIVSSICSTKTLGPSHPVFNIQPKRWNMIWHKTNILHLFTCFSNSFVVLLSSKVFCGCWDSGSSGPATLQHNGRAGHRSRALAHFFGGPFLGLETCFLFLWNKLDVFLWLKEYVFPTFLLTHVLFKWQYLKGGVFCIKWKVSLWHCEV